MTLLDWIRTAGTLAAAAMLTACATLAPAPQFGPGVTVNFVTDTPDAVEYDLSWDAPRTVWGTSHAVAVVPKKASPGPGLVYFHQLGLARNWSEFEQEALANASKGVRSVLVDGNAPWNELWKGDSDDRLMIEAQMIDLRRCVSILVGLPGTDQTRLAFVGHDYGAMYGALLSAEDTPLSAFVLITPAPTWADWISYSQFLPDIMKTYPSLMGDLDPVVKVATRPLVARFFQFSRSDRFLTADVQARLAELPGVKAEFLENSYHDGAAFDGAESRLKWIFSRWGLKGH